MVSVAVIRLPTAGAFLQLDVDDARMYRVLGAYYRPLGGYWLINIPGHLPSG